MTLETETEAVRAGYDRIARHYDRALGLLEAGFLGRCRGRLLARAGGRVLDVGVGTGLNFAHYPPGLEVTGIDLSPEMLMIARERAERLGQAIELREMDVQALAFPDAAFDTVVSSLVFCAVPDPARGLREVLRVLRPGGSVLMLEHVRSCNLCLGWLLDRLNPLTVRWFSEHINRDTGRALREAGAWAVEETSCFLDVFRLLTATKPPATDVR